jgi:hypothetical protein
VHLMQLLFWNQLSTEAVLVHGGILLAFSLALGLWANHRIRAKLVT